MGSSRSPLTGMMKVRGLVQIPLPSRSPPMATSVLLLFIQSNETPTSVMFTRSDLSGWQSEDEPNN